MRCPPVTTLDIKGTTYNLAFDFQAVADAEELTGRSLITGLKQKDFESPSIKLVQAMLYACLKRNHPEVSYIEAKSLVNLRNIHKVWATITVAWAAAMVEPEEGDDSGETPGQS